jgi:hypothetical protein
MDRVVMFGLASITRVFNAIAEVILDIYKAAGFALIMKCIDNFITL